jgi:hypothetical protein
VIEDTFPDNFKRVAYHPSMFIYAWRRRSLEKLFEELNMSNIAVSGVEVWKVEKDIIEVLIPLSNGDIQIFSHKTLQQKEEEWNDYVNRSTKETLDIISDWNLEKKTNKDKVSKIFYHFEFLKE